MSLRHRWINRFAKRSAIVLAASSASAGLVESAFADGSTWTYNGNANWSATTSWLDNIVADGIGNTAGFGLGGAAVNILDTLTVTLDTNRTIGHLAFGDGELVDTPAGWRLQATGGSVLSLQVAAGGLPSINVANLGTGGGLSGPATLFQKIANIIAPLAGNQGFLKGGTGTAVLSANNSGLSGSISLYQGILVLNSAGALGSSTLLTQYSGQLMLRNDSALNFSSTNLVLINEATIGLGNSITTGGLYGTGSNLVHTVGDVTYDQYGTRTLGISGTNGYGLTMGRLTVRDGVNLINQGNVGTINGAGDSNGVNGLGSGQLTIGTITYTGLQNGPINLGGTGSYAGNITITNGLTQTSTGEATLIYSGDKTLSIGGPIGTTGDIIMTGGLTGAGATLQTGLGTMIITNGTLPSGSNLTINGGSLLLNGGALTANVDGLAMGGATLNSASVTAMINAGSGTIALGGNVTVGDSRATNGSLIATAANISGKLDLGSSTRTITVDGASSLDVNAPINGTTGIIKRGTGALNLNNANTYTGHLDVVDGVLAGKVQAAGNSFGSTPVNVSLGGALRLNGIATAGAGTVATLTSKDSGGNEGLIVDATNGGTTTLQINTFGGRESGTRGTIKIVPFTGQLNTKEIINVSTGMPLAVNGILPSYFAVQNSGTDTQLGFASISSNHLVAFNNYATGGINSAASSSVYSQSASETLTASRQVYGLKMGAGVTLSGATQTLTVGDGAGGFGGLIMNGGAALTANTLTTGGTDELNIWSGGTVRNSIASTILLNGDMTTGGSQEIDMSGSLNFGGLTRNLSVAGATVTLSSSNALTNGNFVKRGGGVLAIGGSNVAYAGTIGIEGSGTLQIGTSPIGDVGSGAITNNANLSINRSDTVSFANAISGSGNTWVNGTSTGVLTLTGPLTYTGRTTVQSGTLKINVNNGLPSGTPLRVEGGATFDMNGFNQAFSTISGAGTIINNNSGSAFRTLTINSPGSFNGSIRNGTTGSIALTKNGAGTLELVANNTMSGTVTVNGGTLQVDTAAAAGTGTMILNNAALNINTTGGFANAGMVFSGNSTISLQAPPGVRIFLAGTLAGSNFVLDGGGPSMFTSGTYTWTGGGTVDLVLNGRIMHIGPGGFTAASNPLFMSNFTGTLKFDDSNPAGSRARFSSGNEVFTGGSANATFDFGNGINVMNTRNGSVQFNIGWIQGGTNSIIEGCENGTGRANNYVFGWINGNQTYHGRIRDYETPEGNGIVGFTKLNPSSTLTLKNTLSFTGGITVNAGTLFLASGAQLTNAASIIMNGGTLSMLPGSAITSSRLFATSNANVGGGINVASFPGFSTPSGVNFIGGGTIYGSVNHNAGSINPGAVGGFGTLTFANALQIQGGAMDFDTSAGSTNVLGAGVNDLLKVNGSGSLDLTSGTLRLNFFNGATPAGTTPPPTLAVGQFYPIISYSGSYTGSRSNMFVTGKFRSSFTLEEGTGSLANTLGARVQAIGGPTNSLVWNPINTSQNVWDAAVGFQNWKPLAGAGSLFFFNGDAVTFDDTSTIRTVQITPGLAPTTITVNTAGDYVLTGQGFGSIIGSTSITKNGTGTLYLTGDNSYTGGTTVNGGTLVVGDPNTPTTFPLALGGPNATTTFNNNSNFRFISALNNTFSGPGNTFTSGGFMVFNTGTHRIMAPGSSIFPYPWNVNMLGTGTVQFERAGGASGVPTINVVPTAFTSFAGTLRYSDTLFTTGNGTILRVQGGGNPSMTLDLGNGPSGGGIALDASGQTFTVGALRGGVNTYLKLPLANSTGTLLGIPSTGTFVVGHSTISSTFNGTFKAVTAIQGAVLSTNVVNVVKNGLSSTLTLTQNQPYTGITLVNQGTLALSSPGASNLLSSPTISIGTNGKLDVSGLTSGFGPGIVLNGGQLLISNGDVAGGAVEATATSTVGGTKFSDAIYVDDGATLAPGNNGVGTLTVGSLTLGAANFTVETDQTGIDNIIVSNPDGLQITAPVTLNLVSTVGGFVPGTYTFLDYNGAFQPVAANFTPSQFAYQVNVIDDQPNTRVLLQFINNSAQWFVNSNGSWSTSTNWTSNGVTGLTVVPNAVTFGTFINAPRTVTVNSIVGNTANSVVFDSPISYTIAGTGTLSLDGGGSVPLSVVQGSHYINTPVRLLKTMALSVSPGTSLSFGGTIINANNSGISKSGSGTTTFTRLSINTGSLSVGAGTVLMSVKPTNNSVAGTNIVAGLTISAGAKVDLANNAFIIDYGAVVPTTELRAELADGRLFSSTVVAGQKIGYRLSAAVAAPTQLGMGAVTTFAGVVVDSTAVLARVTYGGDSNLDGTVNANDLYNLAVAWLSTTANWFNGDFNYDGIVNAVDLGILSQNWLAGQGNPLPSSDLEDALDAAGIPLSAVPEPGTVGIVAAGALGLLSRRRRK